MYRKDQEKFKKTDQKDVEEIIEDTSGASLKWQSIKDKFFKAKKPDSSNIDGLELKSGLKILNDVKNHNLILGNDKGKKLNIGLLLPPNINLYYEKKGMRYDSAYKSVMIMKVTNEKQLLYCLYTIGVAGNHYNRHSSVEEVDESKQDALAWEGAFKIAKKLEEHGYSKQDLSKFLKPVMSPTEREEHIKMREDHEQFSGKGNGENGRIVMKFGNGSKVEITKDEKLNIIFINKDGEQFDLRSGVPAGFELALNYWGMNKLDKDKKIIYGPKIGRQQDILSWLHEIGHAQDFVTHKVAFERGNKSKEELIGAKVGRERHAGTGAIKKFRELQKQGYIDQALSNKQILDVAKIGLYSYGQEHINTPSGEDFLNKRLTADDRDNKKIINN